MRIIEPDQDDEQDDGRWRRLSRPAKAAVIIGALFVVGVISQAVNPSAPSTNASADKYLAFHACETYVKDRLRAPATARFRNPVEDDGEVGWIRDGDTWTITSTVDSENGFGAMLRSSFTCTVTDEGGSWHLDGLTLR